MSTHNQRQSSKRGKADNQPSRSSKQTDSHQQDFHAKPSKPYKPRKGKPMQGRVMREDLDNNAFIKNNRQPARKRPMPNAPTNRSAAHPTSRPYNRPANAPRFVPRTPKGTTFVKPPLEPFTTTLWEYPSQHYLPGDRRSPSVQGDPNYAGATPSWIIWQLLTRYTRIGDRVLDPMCGSGTTLDVCHDLNRLGKGFDLVPRRPDIEQADARRLPLPDACCDFVFVDPPYSTHIHYSDHPDCIGKLSANSRDAHRRSGRQHEEPGSDHVLDYYRAMDRVISEIDRVLRPGRFMGLYVSDSYEPHPHHRGHGSFMPIGFELFSMLRQRFDAVDIIAVVRHNTKLNSPRYHDDPARFKSFRRGFNYLFIMHKPAAYDNRHQLRGNQVDTRKNKKGD